MFPFTHVGSQPNTQGLKDMGKTSGLEEVVHDHEENIHTGTSPKTPSLGDIWNDYEGNVSSCLLYTSDAADD